MPTLSWYLNDAFMIVSNLGSAMLGAFWLLYAISHTYKPSFDVTAGKSFGNKLFVYNAIMPKDHLFAPMFYYVASILFYLLGALYDVQAYDDAGSSFGFGLLDVNDINRQWFYATGTVGIICGTLIMGYVLVNATCR
jgi:hypothetical protein